jgi:hypothetical protein
MPHLDPRSLHTPHFQFTFAARNISYFFVNGKGYAISYMKYIEDTFSHFYGQDARRPKTSAGIAHFSRLMPVEETKEKPKLTKN